MNQIEVLKFLANNVPQIELGKAIEFAQKVEVISIERNQFENALGILSEQVVGLDQYGYPPEELRGEFGRPALRMAICTLISVHASIVCGPGPNGMDSFLEKMDRLSHRLGKDNPV